MTTLTLKSVKNANPTTPVAKPSVIAGRNRRSQAIKLSNVLLETLQATIQNGYRVFIQMRQGTGYCGTPVSVEDGWLTLSEVTIHGTKQNVQTHTILVQILDGSLIAHLHPVTPQEGMKNVKS